jgi:taurine dioxygenase
MKSSKADCRAIRVTPLVGALGAEISGVDLRQKVSDELSSELNKAFSKYKLLVFRDQAIDWDQLCIVGGYFGELFHHPLVEPIPESPYIIRLKKEKDEKINNGGTWHKDLTFLKRPPLGSILRLIEAPEAGGDTLFSDLTLAYDALSKEMKRYLDKLTCLHTASQLFGPTGYYTHNKPAFSVKANIDPTDFIATHPIVTSHPVTGVRSLYVNPPYIDRILGIPDRESSQLLGYLYQHCASGEFCTRVRWETDTVTMWDNHCTMHYALNDYHGQRREGIRVTIAGSRPK